MISKCPKCNGSKLEKRIGGIYAKCGECSGVGHVKTEIKEDAVIDNVWKDPVANSSLVIIEEPIESKSTAKRIEIQKEPKSNVYKGRKQGTRVNSKQA